MKKKRNRHATLGARLSCWLMISVEFALTRFPMPVSVAIGGGFGRLMGWVLPFRGAIVTENITNAFPDLSPREVKRLRRKFYVHFGRWIAETCFMGRISSTDQSKIFIEENEAVLERMPDVNHGLIVMMGHMGSWELMGAHFAQRDYRISAVAKPLHNPYYNEHLTKSRAKAGVEILFTATDELREIPDRLNRGEVVSFLCDQDARQFGTFVDFLGRPASTHRGPAMHSLRTGKPILPMFTIRERGATHRIIYGEPIFPPEAPEDIDIAVRDLTQAFTRQLEAVVRRYPDQYFWIHRRWKTQPEDLKPKRRKRAGLEP